MGALELRLGPEGSGEARGNGAGNGRHGCASIRSFLSSSTCQARSAFQSVAENAACHEASHAEYLALIIAESIAAYDGYAKGTKSNKKLKKELEKIEEA